MPHHIAPIWAPGWRIKSHRTARSQVTSKIGRFVNLIESARFSYITTTTYVRIRLQAQLTRFENDPLHTCTIMPRKLLCHKRSKWMPTMYLAGFLRSPLSLSTRRDEAAGVGLVQESTRFSLSCPHVHTHAHMKFHQQTPNSLRESSAARSLNSATQGLLNVSVVQLSKINRLLWTLFGGKSLPVLHWSSSSSFLFNAKIAWMMEEWWLHWHNSDRKGGREKCFQKVLPWSWVEHLQSTAIYYIFHDCIRHSKSTIAASPAGKKNESAH